MADAVVSVATWGQTVNGLLVARTRQRLDKVRALAAEIAGEWAADDLAPYLDPESMREDVASLERVIAASLMRLKMAAPVA